MTPKRGAGRCGTHRQDPELLQRLGEATAADVGTSFLRGLRLCEATSSSAQHGLGKPCEVRSEWEERGRVRLQLQDGPVVKEVVPSIVRPGQRWFVAFASKEVNFINTYYMLSCPVSTPPRPPMVWTPWPWPRD